jgi:DNA-binding IclR family transcriptional regulator
MAKPALARYPAPALDKGLDLIELLASNPQGMSLSDLAVAAGRKVSEIFRMVDCLKRRGYIAADGGSDRLQLTLRLFELAHRHPPTQRLIAASLPQMQALADDVGQSCHLAVHSAGEMLVIAQVDSPRHMGFAVHVGARISLTQSASGRVYLAFIEQADVARVLAGRAQQPKRSDLAESLANAKAIQKKFYVSMPSDFIRGVINMSYPIRGNEGSCVASLTIPYMQWQGQPSFGGAVNTRKRLGVAAHAISLAIGAQAL